jgi:hypothetical protein
MVDINRLEQRLIEFEERREAIRQLEREIEGELKQLEKDTFNGLTYFEFVNTQKQEIQVNEKIRIRVDTYNIYGEYKLDDEIVLTADTTIYADQSRISYRVEYKNKTVRELPKKYENEAAELKRECFKLKVENPSQKYQERHRLSTLY